MRGVWDGAATDATGGRMTSLRAFIGDVWRLALPYWSSEDRWAARGLLAVLIAMNLGLVYLSVLLNRWNNAFYNTLQDRDLAAFFQQLLHFGWLAALSIILAVYQLYLNQMLQIRWRRWLTERYLATWLAERVYYRMQVADGRADNPDQRIADDVRLFVDRTLTLALGLLSAVVTLGSFFVVLWGLSGPLQLPPGPSGITVPGYLVWAALFYAAAGTWLTMKIGRPLVALNFQQQRFEADFRFGLVRLRENAEGVALYRGEASEGTGLRSSFDRVRANFFDLMRFTKRLTFFTVGYSQVAIIFPILVAAPRYFSGAISLGVLFQISNAFAQVQGSLSWFVDSYGSLAVWKATVDRLLTFQEALDRASVPTDPAVGLERVLDGTPGLHAEDIDIGLPNGRIILNDASFDIEPGDSVLFTGPTGSGKSTLFRAIAGIWPFGKGKIQVPANARLLFLPQRPYIPIASLRDAVSFPDPVGAFSDDEKREVLRETGLGDFADRLDEVQNWALSMSGGEQQRLALARALLQKPDWLFLDEATASLDEDAERELYQLLHRRLPGATIVSIAHRPQLASYHQRRYDLASAGLKAQTVVT
jgi:putative ATP-binding cassette transporter